KIAFVGFLELVVQAHLGSGGVPLGLLLPVRWSEYFCISLWASGMWLVGMVQSDLKVLLLKGAEAKSFMHWNRAARLTETSPSCMLQYTPPLVPVVKKTRGRASSIICASMSLMGRDMVPLGSF